VEREKKDMRRVDFLVDEKLWKEFGVVCKKHDLTRSQVLRVLIRQTVNGRIVLGEWRKETLVL